MKAIITRSADKEQTNFQGCAAHIQPLITPILEPDVSRTFPKPNIPYPSRLNQEKLREKSNAQMMKFLEIFQKIHFDLSFADALLYMPQFAPMFKSLISNKEKLFELSSVPLNENCSAVLLKKLPEKLGDPGKFLIPCDFPGMVECSALADLGASINLMPVSVWKRLSLPKLTTTHMTLKLADRFITHPKVPLIFGRPFLRTSRALIDVYGEEITLRFNDEAITFNLGQTLRYSSDHYAESVNQIDIIDVACDEYSQELLGFSDGIDDEDFDPEGDICLIEKLLNEDPFQLPPMDLKQVEETKAKSSIEEPPELELKDLPSHLEYAYLEGTDKLPVIIAKSLKDDEKEALLKISCANVLLLSSIRSNHDSECGRMCYFSGANQESILLYIAGLSPTWKGLGSVPIMKGPGGEVLTMAEFLRLLDLGACKIVVGTLLPPNFPVDSHLSNPAARLEDIPPKTPVMERAEVACPKVIAAREKKKQRAEDLLASKAIGGGKVGLKRRIG
ncbi:reverse transcriptase domain-containing protein [Tanacetum coccineum]